MAQPGRSLRARRRRVRRRPVGRGRGRPTAHVRGLEEEANRWCSALSAWAGAGDHVAHLRNGVDCLAVFLGIPQTRAVPIASTSLFGPELQYLYTTRRLRPGLPPGVRPRGGGCRGGLTRSATPSWWTTVPGAPLRPGPWTPARSWPRPPDRLDVERSADDLSRCSPAAPPASPGDVAAGGFVVQLGGGADYTRGAGPDEYHQSRSGTGDPAGTSSCCR